MGTARRLHTRHVPQTAFAAPHPISRCVHTLGQETARPAAQRRLTRLAHTSHGLGAPQGQGGMWSRHFDHLMFQTLLHRTHSKKAVCPSSAPRTCHATPYTQATTSQRRSARGGARGGGAASKRAMSQETVVKRYRVVVFTAPSELAWNVTSSTSHHRRGATVAPCATSRLHGQGVEPATCAHGLAVRARSEERRPAARLSTAPLTWRVQ